MNKKEEDWTKEERIKWANLPSIQKKIIIVDIKKDEEDWTKEERIEWANLPHIE